MESKVTACTRRDLLKVASLGTAGALIGQMAFTKNAFANEPVEAGLVTPKIKATLINKDTGETIVSVEDNVQALMPSNIQNEEPSIQVLNFSQEINDNELICSTATKIALPLSEEANANAIAAGYVEEVTESPSDFGVYARAALGVNWGVDKSSIQITQGTFEVSSSDPFISYFSTFYGMMQKEHYLSNAFSGRKKTITTGWPVSSFNAATDQYTCGGAVGGAYYSMYDGVTYSFQFDLYF